MTDSTTSESSNSSNVSTSTQEQASTAGQVNAPLSSEEIQQIDFSEAPLDLLLDIPCHLMTEAQLRAMIEQTNTLTQSPQTLRAQLGKESDELAPHSRKRKGAQKKSLDISHLLGRKI
jgi:hypothetical protein